MLVGAKKIDPSELRQEVAKEEGDISVDSTDDVVREKLRQHGLLEFDASKQEYLYATNGSLVIRTTSFYSDARKKAVRDLFQADADAAKAKAAEAKETLEAAAAKEADAAAKVVAAKAAIAKAKARLEELRAKAAAV